LSTTSGQNAFTLRSLSIKTAHRFTPPKRSQRLRSLSHRRGKGKPNFSFQALLAEAVSLEAPITCVSLARNSSFKAAKPWPSLVQPPVSAFGYHHISRFLPSNDSGDNMRPDSSGRLHPGAASPIADRQEAAEACLRPATRSAMPMARPRQRGARLPSDMPPLPRWWTVAGLLLPLRVRCAKLVDGANAPCDRKQPLNRCTATLVRHKALPPAMRRRRRGMMKC